MSLKRRLFYRMFSVDRRLTALEGTILDVGCSDGRGSEVLGHADGVDVVEPATCRRARFFQGDARSLPFPDHSYDHVVALDLIEHFEKADSLIVLSELERVARRSVFVVTPNGYLPTPSATGPDMHRCGYTIDELTALGYDIEAWGGPKSLRGEGGVFWGGPIGQAAVLATQNWWPTSNSFTLVGTKSVNASAVPVATAALAV